MISMKISIAYSDGRADTVTVRPAHILAFEIHFDTAVTTAFRQADGLKLSHVYYLAWKASATTLEFDNWIEGVDAIEVEDDGIADAVPLVPATSDGSSQNSHSLPESLHAP